MVDIVGVGSAVFDTLVRLECYPNEDTKTRAIQTRTQCGGPCATAMAAAARLGVKTAYMGALGDDLYGTYMLNSLKQNGVECQSVRIVPDTQSFHATVWLSLKDATRTCVWNKGSVPDLRPEQVDLELLQRTRYLHLDGHQYDAAMYASIQARKLGIKISLDAGNVNEQVRSLLPLTDILIGSEEFSIGMTGAETAENAAEILWAEYHPEVLIITQGKKGGFLFENGEVRRYPSFPVHAVDTNGAGDTFHGAFLAAKCYGKSDYEAACFASAASALKCTTFGTQDGLPTLEKTEEFLCENGWGMLV